MKQRALFLVCTLLLLTSAVIAQQQVQPDPVLNRPEQPPQKKWPKYTVKDEEFSVELPTMPAMTSGVVFQPRLQKYRVERHLKTSLDGIVYTIDVFENSEPHESLDDFIAEQILSSDYDLSTAHDVELYGNRGKQFLAKDKTQPAMVQVFATERWLYRFAASGSDAANAAVKQFFSSIVLGKSIDAIPVSDGPGMPLVLDSGERIYKGSEVDTKVRLISKPEPTYTEDARSNRIQGTVVLRAIFAKNGQVTHIRVVAALPYGLTERCVDAVKKIKFTPATKEGQPVSMWIQLEYNFNL